MNGERRKNPPTPCEKCKHPINRQSAICQECARSGKYKAYETIRNAVYAKKKRETEIVNLQIKQHEKDIKDYYKERKERDKYGK